MFNHMEPPQMKQAPATPSRKPEKLLRLPEVENLVGLGKSSIYAGMKAGTFPPCVRLSARAVAWRESDIAAWQDERALSVVGAQPNTTSGGQ